LHEVGEVIVTFGPQDEMPVIGHHTVTTETHWEVGQSLDNDLLERGIVVAMREQPHPPHASIENVVDKPPGRSTTTTRHIKNLRPTLCTRQLNRGLVYFPVIGLANRIRVPPENGPDPLWTIAVAGTVLMKTKPKKRSARVDADCCEGDRSIFRDRVDWHRLAIGGR
jgi:hypothetical protein